MPEWFACTTAIIGVIIPSTALIVNLRASRKASDEDIGKRAAQDALVNYKLDNILNDVQKVKNNADLTNEKVDKLAEKIVKLEASNAALHERVDKLEEKWEERK